MMHRLVEIVVSFENDSNVVIDLDGDVTFPEKFMDEAAVKFILQLMTSAGNYIDAYIDSEEKE